MWVSALYLYPIKSCGGIRVDALDLETPGARFDREWMVVDAETGLFVTQRQYPNCSS